MLKLLLATTFLLTACPTGGNDPCTATYTCAASVCTCEDGAVCDDPTAADEESPSNCLNACEVCETSE